MENVVVRDNNGKLLSCGCCNIEVVTQEPSILLKSVGFIGVELVESLGKQIIPGLGTPSGHLFLALAFRIFFLQGHVAGSVC